MLVGALLFVWLSAPTLVDMWHRWFPAWDDAGASWVHRLLGGDSYFAHGPLALLAAGALAASTWRRGGRRDERGHLIGWCVLVAALLLYGLARWADVMFVAAYALLAAAAAGALVTGGWAALQLYGWALALAALAVPWPMVGMARLNLALKELAIDGAMTLVGPLAGGQIARQGSYVLLAEAGSSQPAALLIGSVCSGLRSLIAILFTVVLFAAVCRLRGWRCGLLIVAALPLALMVNVARVAVLIVGASWWGVVAASEGGWLHDMSGPAMFLGALALLGLLEVGLHRPTADRRSHGDTFWAAMPSVRPAWTVAGLLALSAALSTWLAGAPETDTVWADSRLLMPSAAIQVGDELLTSEAIGLDVKTRAWLASGRWCYERFIPVDGVRARDEVSAPIDLLIVEAGRRRDLLHPPEVCLTGRGDELLQRVVRPGPEGQHVVELLVQRGPARELHIFVYQHGSTRTTSFAVQHVRMMAHASADTRGRLIRLSMPLAAGANTIEAARARLDAAMAAVTALLHRADVSVSNLARG